jgi:hypothetical protein
MCHARLASYGGSHIGDPHGYVVCKPPTSVYVRREYQLSIRREPGDRIPHSVLPPAEMGTAHNLSSMDIFYTVATKQATYHFVANPQINLVRITKLIRKQQKGYDQSTTMSIETARKFARQLQAK